MPAHTALRQFLEDSLNKEYFMSIHCISAIERHNIQRSMPKIQCNSILDLGREKEVVELEQREREEEIL